MTFFKVTEFLLSEIVNGLKTIFGAFINVTAVVIIIFLIVLILNINKANDVAFFIKKNIVLLRILLVAIVFIGLLCSETGLISLCITLLCTLVMLGINKIESNKTPTIKDAVVFNYDEEHSNDQDK